MFGQKLSSIPNQNYRVETHPTIEQINEIIEKARTMSGIKHNYLWEIPKDFKKYTLSIHCKENDEEDIDWWLHEENVVGTKMLWFHKTKDIAVIYPQLLSAIGAKHPLEETAEDKSRAEKEKEHKATSLGERFKRSTSSADLSQTSSSIDEHSVQTAAQATEAGSIRLMSGSLKLRPIAWLLQTAQQSELTGELRVANAQNRVIVVQFGLGRPIHAYTTDKTGSDAIIELFCWQDGTATFVEGTRPDIASVQESTEDLLKKGSKLLENLGFLTMHGMDEYSVLTRPPIGLSEEQLEERLKDGVDYGSKMQMAFYAALDGRLSLREVGERISLDISRVIGVAVNLLRLGLVLTPDGRSLRQVAQASSTEAFGNMHSQAQSGAQPTLKPPAGFFGGGGGFGGAVNAPHGGAGGDALNAPGGGAGGGAAYVPHGGAGMGTVNAPGGQAGDAGAGPFNARGVEAGFAGAVYVPHGGEGSGSAINAPHDGGGTEAGVPATFRTSQAQDELRVPQVTHEMSGRHKSLPTPGHASPPSIREFFEIGVPTTILDYDPNSAKSVFASLTNPETNALTFPAFQFLLDREFARAFRFSSEFSLLIFCIRLGGGDGSNNRPAASAMPMSSLALATQAIAQIKRDVDVFGHVGDKSFGLILPGVGTNQSHALVDRIVADLPKLAPRLGGFWPILHFGIAGVPDDARDVPSLFQAAQTAMLHAANKNYTRIRSADMHT